MATFFFALAAFITSTVSQLTWNAINPSPLNTAYGMLAIGHNTNTQSLFMLGGLRYESTFKWYKKVMKYNINTSTFEQHDDLSSTTFPANGIQFMSQMYTQVNNSLWFIVNQEFGVFSMDTKSFSYPYKYNNIAVTIPLTTYYEAALPSQPCLISYQSRYLIIIGGDNLQGSITTGKQFQIYDIATNIWYYNNLPNLLTSRSQFCCAIVKDYLYAIGGVISSPIQYTNTIEKIYLNMSNIQNEQWHYINNTLTEAKEGHRCVNVGNNIYIVGGYNGQFLSTVDKIYTVHDTVSKNVNDISIQRSGIGLVTANGLLYAIGGYDDSNTNGVTNVFEYSSKIPTLSPTLNPTATQGSSQSPSIIPSQSPSKSPTKAPSTNPFPAPTNNPSLIPTESPINPTYNPSVAPTDHSTIFPTKNPISIPSQYPSVAPTDHSTIFPTKNPISI
eukprot:400405_1